MSEVEQAFRDALARIDRAAPPFVRSGRPTFRTAARTTLTEAG